MTEELALRALQNGSDIRGIAISTSDQEATLTIERVMKISHSFVKWLQEEKGLYASLEKPIKIAIGQDSRLSGNDIKEALIDGMQDAYVEIIDCELSTTPAMFMTTIYEEFQVDASIMITASHMPFEYNGLKFFTTTGGAENNDIKKIIDFAVAIPENLSPQKQKINIIKKDLLSVYANDLVEKIRKGITNSSNPEKPLLGRHIIVDAGNGAGGFFVDKVLLPLGANTEGSQFLDPDGTFPNHEPNPDNKAAMKSLQRSIIAYDADLGIIFDTDVDRSAIVDDEGNVFNRNNLIALVSAILLKEQPGATIVTNSATSQHLEQFIKSLGGKQDRYLTGYRNVINRAIERDQQGENAILAIETSGHAALKENYYLDDGAYLIAKLLMADASLSLEEKKLGDLISELEQPHETLEFRFKIIDQAVKETGNQVIENFHRFLEEQPDITLVKNHLEGIRADFTGQFGKGWFILRMSLHEPLLVWTIENDVEKRMSALEEKILPFFMSQEGLDHRKYTRK